MPLPAFLLLGLFMIWPFWADSWAQESASADQAIVEAMAQTRSQIEQTRADLVAARERIAEERVGLARQVHELQAEVVWKRRIWDVKRIELNRRDALAETTRNRAELLIDQVRTIRSLLVELRRDTETRLGIADAASSQPELKHIDSLLDSALANPEVLTHAASRLLNLNAERARNAGLIRATTGAAIGPDGEEVSGTFIHVGGVQSLFLSADGSLAGLIRIEHGSPNPHVWPFDGRGTRATHALVTSGSSAIPLDLTSGVVFRSSEAKRSTIETLKAGGVVMIPIIIVGLLSFGIGIWKFVQLLRVDIAFDRPFAELATLLRRGDLKGASLLVEAAKPPLKRLLEEGVDHHAAPKGTLEEILHEALITEIPRLEQHLSFLAVGAAVSPLLGLLGTVTGMIHTFNLISVFGTGDPRMLSGGISEALLTTQAGLAVAIPLLFMHAFLNRRVNAIADGLEKSATSFINTLKLRNGVAAATAAGK